MVSVLVGGVGQLYQGDYDVGRIVVERLAVEDLGREVVVEDFYYGAVAVMQRLEELQPYTLVLVGAARRGRVPGTVERRRIHDDVPQDPAAVQRAVEDAVTGYVTIDLALDVAAGFGTLPARTVAIEVEPAATEPSETLSSIARAALHHALELVRAEVRRAPLLRLADELRTVTDRRRLEPSGALDALEELLRQLRVLDSDGHWGATFALRDRLRRKVAEGESSRGMDHLDWGLWWALIEELDRLQPLEVSSGS